jgi:hypothetical protein
MAGRDVAVAGNVIYVDAEDGKPWTCPDCGRTEPPDWAFHKCKPVKAKGRKVKARKS